MQEKHRAPLNVIVIADHRALIGTDVKLPIQESATDGFPGVGFTYSTLNPQPSKGQNYGPLIWALNPGMFKNLL